MPLQIKIDYNFKDSKIKAQRREFYINDAVIFHIAGSYEGLESGDYTVACLKEMHEEASIIGPDEYYDTLYLVIFKKK